MVVLTDVHLLPTYSPSAGPSCQCRSELLGTETARIGKVQRRPFSAFWLAMELPWFFVPTNRARHFFSMATRQIGFPALSWRPNLLAGCDLVWEAKGHGSCRSCFYVSRPILESFALAMAASLEQSTEQSFVVSSDLDLWKDSFSGTETVWTVFGQSTQLPGAWCFGLMRRQPSEWPFFLLQPAVGCPNTNGVGGWVGSPSCCVFSPKDCDGMA